MKHNHHYLPVTLQNKRREALEDSTRISYLMQREIMEKNNKQQVVGDPLHYKLHTVTSTEVLSGIPNIS
jgi:hypothetical protein